MYRGNASKSAVKIHDACMHALICKSMYLQYIYCTLYIYLPALVALQIKSSAYKTDEDKTRYLVTD